MAFGSGRTREISQYIIQSCSRLWNFSTFQYKLNLPQVKRHLILTKKIVVEKLPHQLPNHLRFMILRN